MGSRVKEKILCKYQRSNKGQIKVICGHIEVKIIFSGDLTFNDRERHRILAGEIGTSHRIILILTSL